MYDNKPEKRKFPKIAGLIIIILLVIFGKSFLFNGKKDDNNKKAEETVKVTETTTETQSFLGKLEDSANKAESKVKEKLDGLKEGKTTTVSSNEKTDKKSKKDKDKKKDSDKKEKDYKFRNDKLKNQHYEKHGKEMGFKSADDYENAASDVANSQDALHKKEKEDGDDVFYIEDTNDFVVISGDGYIRTYFNPDSGKAYYDKQ